MGVDEHRVHHLDRQAAGDEQKCGCGLTGFLEAATGDTYLAMRRRVVGTGNL
ncbi:hypothetical protein [Dactylosporangium fulvum]|uniref:Uncharacterized protein n=1 Tax=Dactylosporangium fulvum TaxID=53359 RepID=A0ABY5VS17_9ACTN|nr:hypothetical protein [Dactylosporangium fulvum]UWP80543.1 hypothetical protein Dfulv_36055 [Dactylosporangium fulvum]